MQESQKQVVSTLGGLSHPHATGSNEKKTLMTVVFDEYPRSGGPSFLYEQRTHAGELVVADRFEEKVEPEMVGRGQE
jgi:hypothetical protein